MQDAPSFGGKEHRHDQAFDGGIFGLAAFLGGTLAHADYFVYTNRASFESAITSEATETFNELGPNTQVFNTTGLGQANGLTQPLMITSSNDLITTGSSSSFAGYYPSNGTYLLGPISTASTSGLMVTLPVNMQYTAAGADVAGFGSSSVVTMKVTTALGASFTSSIAVDASTPNSPFGFLGVIITTPNDYVTSLTYSTGVGGNQSVVLDNLSTGFAPQAVPEPASMALMAAGSLAIGAGALRRRRLRRQPA